MKTKPINLQKKLGNQLVPNFKNNLSTTTLNRLPNIHAQYQIPVPNTERIQQEFTNNEYYNFPHSAKFLDTIKPKTKNSLKIKKLMNEVIRNKNEKQVKKNVGFQYQGFQKNSKSLPKLPLNSNKILSKKVVKKHIPNKQMNDKIGKHMKSQSNDNNPQKISKNVNNEIQKLQYFSKNTNSSSKNSDSEINIETNVIANYQIQNQSLKNFYSDLLQQNKLLKDQIKQNEIVNTKNIGVLEEQIKYLSEKIKGKNEIRIPHIYQYPRFKSDNYQIIPQLDSKLEYSNLNNNHNDIYLNTSNEYQNQKKYQFLQVESHFNIKKASKKQKGQIQSKIQNKLKNKKKSMILEQKLSNINSSTISQLQLQSLASVSYFEA